MYLRKNDQERGIEQKARQSKTSNNFRFRKIKRCAQIILPL